MKSAEEKSHIETLFQQAKDLSAEQRERFLQKACDSNPLEIVQAVRRLLDADVEAQHLMRSQQKSDVEQAGEFRESSSIDWEVLRREVESLLAVEEADVATFLPPVGWTRVWSFFEHRVGFNFSFLMVCSDDVSLLELARVANKLGRTQQASELFERARQAGSTEATQDGILF